MKITKNNQKEREFINKLISGSQVVLMRHAESKHNEESKKLELNEHSDYDFLRNITSIEQRDATITRVGKEQCKITSKITNELDVRVVLISPLRRTLETAYNVFKTHPNFDIIYFKIKDFKIKMWIMR